MSDTAVGFDGRPYEIGDRVEIHPGTDLWMMGARYGKVVGMSITSGDRVRVTMDKVPGIRSGSEDTFRKLFNTTTTQGEVT
jgi:hypothetical protein